MDRKIIFFLAALLLAGCKQNNWTEWKVQNELWLEQKAQEAGVMKTSDGLLYKIIADPTPNDAKPNPTSYVTCDYTVKLINGYQVDGGSHISFYLSNTIPGFCEGCTKIHNQGDIELYIPASLGYDYTKFQSDEYDEAEGTGTEGTSSYVPPYSTLIYEIHICSVSGN